MAHHKSIYENICICSRAGSEAPAAANGSEDIDLASENMKAKLKVGKDEKIIFTYEVRTAECLCLFDAPWTWTP